MTCDKVKRALLNFLKICPKKEVGEKGVIRHIYTMRSYT
jgi:hypothetical protein